MADNTDRIDSLIEALQNKNRETRISAIEELWNIYPKAQEAVPALIQLIEDPNEHEGIRYAAAIVLANTDPKAEKAIPVLINLLQDQEYEDYDIRKTVVETFRYMSSSVVFPALIKAIDTKKNQYITAYLLYELSFNNSLPQQAIDVLENVFSDESNELEVRWMAAVALQKIGLNMQDFFANNNLKNPDDQCLKDRTTYFDVYTHKCVKVYYISYEKVKEVIHIVANRMGGNQNESR